MRLFKGSVGFPKVSVRLNTIRIILNSPRRLPIGDEPSDEIIVYLLVLVICREIYSSQKRVPRLTSSSTIYIENVPNHSLENVNFP